MVATCDTATRARPKVPARARMRVEVSCRPVAGPMGAKPAAGAAAVRRLVVPFGHKVQPVEADNKDGARKGPRCHSHRVCDEPRTEAKGSRDGLLSFS